MENEDTKYVDGDGDDFTIFLFSEKPKEKNSIKLELNPGNKDIKIGLMIFQELLMIFTAGIKYLFSKNEKVDITSLNENDISLMNEYFASIGHIIIIETFTIEEYLSNMKLPNYFKDQHLIKDDTMLRDIYHETAINTKIYRISFDFLR
tara:strand:- start:36 stop:482 length:447 start_codon:yes stop_codon:yes gene_type:complete